MRKFLYWTALDIAGMIIISALIGHYYFGQPRCTPAQEIQVQQLLAHAPPRLPQDVKFPPCLTGDETFGSLVQGFRKAWVVEPKVALAYTGYGVTILFAGGYMLAILLHALVIGIRYAVSAGRDRFQGERYA